MSRGINRPKKVIYFSIITFALLFNILITSFLFSHNLYNDEMYTDNGIGDDLNPNTQDIVQDLYTKEWLDNPTFETPIDPWYNETTEDISDVNASTSGETANFEILGETYTYSNISGTPLASEGWIKSANPSYPAEPNQAATLTGSGAYASHYWDEGADQQVAVQWEKNIYMNNSMEDYVVTSASLNMTVNATVEAFGGANGAPTPGHGIEVAGDDTSDNPDYTTGDQFNRGDFIRYYVNIADINKNKNYSEVIAFQNTTLGTDSAGSGSGTLDYMYDHVVEVDDENDLIFILNNLFHSYNNYNLTLIIGIRINCEDNFYTDYDDFEDIYISSVDLSFTYEKEIDRDTSISWNQVGNKITGTNVNIVNATLNFKYKVDQIFPAVSSNAEFRLIINGTQHSETIKLSEATTSFQDAKDGGFEVGYLIRKDVNISVSIQVYIAYPFNLNQTIIISIDNASLVITYSESIIESETELDLFLDGLNKTLEKSIEVTMGYSVNITTRYKNQTNFFIQSATVQLGGLGAPKDLTENIPLEHYNITIHTSNLQIGNNFLTISANKTYFESIEIQINIKVLERETVLQLFLDRNNKTLDKSIQMIYGNSGNITITYKDKELDPNIHIGEASVNLTGFGAPKSLIEDIILKQYTFIIDTSDLGLGNTYLTVNAQKENYTYQSIRFKIEVIERNSYIDKVFLNRTESTGIEIPWNEPLNIAITYNDTATNSFIDNALVQLTGTGISSVFNENSPYNYTIDLNTGDLQLGINFLTISAIKDNYTLSSRIITITILERTTTLRTFLNQTESIGIEIPWNEILNIAIIYNDASTNSFISNAIVQLSSTGISEIFTENSPLNYSLDINTNALNLGANILTISAKKDNYTLSSTTITISVLERSTYLEIYINNSMYLTSQFYNSSVGEYLNISVLYKDFNTGDLIDSALVQLIESGNTYNLTENLIFNSYDIIVEMEQLGAGVKFLTVSAIKDNYTRSSEFVSLINEEKETRLELFLDGTQFLDGETIELEVIDTLNITVKYLDNITHSFLNGATLDLIDSGQLDENPIQEFYNRTIKVFDLGGTLNRLSIIAQIDNYQVALIEFFVQVIERKSEGTLLLNEINKTGDPYLELPMGSFVNVTIKFIDSKTGNHIPEADVQLDGDLTDVLIENSTLEQYSLIIDTTQLSIGVNILTIIAERPNFQLFTIQKMYLNIKRINTSIITLYGNNTISKRPGDSVTLEIALNNLDFGGTIKGASVTYRWQFEDGVLTDSNNDGVYDAVIRDLPEGTYIVTIYAFLGDNYDFEPFEIVLSVVREPTEDPGIYLGLLIIVSIGAALLTGYIIAYQRVLKFPKAVRKVRKYRTSLKRKSGPSLSIISREKGFRTIYKEEIENLKKMRAKPVSKPSEIKKKIEKKPIGEPDKLIDKSLEKKVELDKLVKDTLENGQNS